MRRLQSKFLIYGAAGHASLAPLEDIDTIMRTNQARFVARSMVDPAGVGDILQEKRRTGTGGTEASGGCHKRIKARMVSSRLPIGC